MYRNNVRDPDSTRVRAVTNNRRTDDIDEEEDEEYGETRHHKIHWWLIILALIIVFGVVSYLLGWTNQWSKGLHDAFPNVNFDWMNNPNYVDDGTPAASARSQAPTAVPTAEPVQPTAPPVTQPTEPPVPTAPPAQAEVPVVTAAPIITEAPVQPTAPPASHGTFVLAGEIHVKVNGEDVVLRKFSYHGGYIPADDPRHSTLEKETADSYGPSIYGNTPQELTYNWLRELCKSPHQIIRLRTQMGMIKPKSLEEENRLAEELASKPDIEYDAVVNETLEYFYGRLDGGRIESSVDWALENYMTDSESGILLHGRTNGDDDTEIAKKDILLTFYAKGADKTFVSSERGWYNTLNDARQSKKKFSQRAWVNMTEGGTWKWKPKGGNPSSPTDPPPVITPTPAPVITPTPTPVVTSTPTPVPVTPTPTPTSRPTKDPGQRPTVSDAPIGGGSTDPEHATDPQTTSAPPTSTPAPAATATPAPTAAPTAVPTAVVRPTEVCETTVAPPIREDTATPPPAEEHHNVPTQEPRTVNDGNNTGDFDPDSI